MDYYTSHTTYSAPLEVKAYLDYLADVAAYAKLLGVFNIFDQAQDAFNKILSEWNEKAQAKLKAEKRWYDTFFDTKREVFVHLPFDTCLETSFNLAQVLYDKYEECYGEIYAKNQIASSLKDMLDNPQKHIDEKLRLVKILEDTTRTLF